MVKKFALLAACLVSVFAFMGQAPGEGSFVGNAQSGNYFLDEIVVVFTMEDGMTHYSAEYDADIAEADLVFELGTELSFAHTGLKESDQDGEYSSTVARHGMATQTWENGTTDQRIRLLRLGFDEVLPTDGRFTVVSAELKGVMHSTSAYHGEFDTTLVSLMSADTDTFWYQPANLLAGAGSGYQYYASSSWTWQKVRRDEDISTSFAPAGTSSDPWSFGSFDNYFWNISDYSDMSTVIPDSCGLQDCASNESYKKGNIIRTPFPIVMQAIMDGAVNNGLMFAGRANGSARFWNIFNWETSSACQHLRPWIKLTLAFKPSNNGLPDGKRGVFLFQTDDQRRLANLAYMEEMNKVGGKYTIYVREDAMGGANQLTWDELYDAYKQGHEIGAHSRWHQAIGGDGLAWAGFNHYGASDGVVLTEYTRGVDPSDFTPAATSWDSLLADMDPIWIHEGLRSVGASLSDLERSGRVGKGVACPNNTFSPAVIRAAEYHGYRVLRVGETFRKVRSDDQREWSTVAVRGDADTPLVVAEVDSARIGRIQADPDQPRNAILHPNTLGTDEILGDENATPTEFEVRRNMRAYLERVLATREGVASFYTHDFKTPNPAGYANGVNQDELGWMLSVADSMGFWITTTIEYQNWMLDQFESIATPAAYPNVPAWELSDRLWYRHLTD